MPAIINYKICDQASACGGIEVCPVGAIVYNEKNKKIEIDNEKCIACGLCEPTCPIGAIGVAKTQEEFEKLKTIIEEDPRTPDDLFVDRYGADIISEDIIIEENEVFLIIETGKNAIIEIIDLNNARCLLKSIPIKEIKERTQINAYYRCLSTSTLLKKLSIKITPALIVINGKKTVKIVNGYFEINNKEKLFKKLNK